MPYYREQYVNRAVSGQSFNPDGSTLGAGPVVLDSTELMTFRGRERSDALYSKEQDASTVDPYAAFLESTSRKRYQARLKERGLPAEGDPDRGHAFELKRHTVFGQPTTITKKTGANPPQTFVGAFVTPSIGAESSVVHAGTIFSPAPYKETGLDAFAQQAYNRTAPTAVVFDAGQFLGELREGLPRLIPDLLKGQASLLRKAGSDYLNSEFGWKPLISDLQNAGKSLLAATDSFSQMGRRVHRSYSLPETEMSELGGYTGIASIRLFRSRGFAPAYDPNGITGDTSTSATLNTTYYLTKRRSSKRWFEGEFTSFMPLGFDANDYFQRVKALVDPRITPATLWELAPWSWLVDWNLRIGDTIRANEINANDRLVMHYGYAMETTVYETKVDWQSTGDTSSTIHYTGRPTFGIRRSETVYKRRLRANPYGFRTGGIGSLTGGQAGVLSALGLSKFK